MLQFTDNPEAPTIATLANVNLRIEKIGQKGTRPAADLKFSVNIPARQLDEIEAGLHRALYRSDKEEGHQADLIADPGNLTTLRFPKFKPLQVGEDYPGYDATIRWGAIERGEVGLAKVTLKGITVEAQNGGTVKLSFSLGAHPDPEDVAAIYELMGKDVEISLAPPSLSMLAELRKKTPASAGADEGEEEEEEGEAPGVDLTAPAGRAFPDALDGRSDKRKH